MSVTRSRNIIVNVTASPEYCDAFDQLIKDTGATSRSALVILAVKELAKARGVTLPPRLQTPEYYRE